MDLDRLDLGILKVLLVNNGAPPGSPGLRKSFRSIAEDLGVDQGTVRSRMRKFQERRVLKGWYLGVGPGLIGRHVAHVWFGIESQHDKEALVDKLMEVRGVERVCNYLGPKLSLVLLYEKEKDLDISLRRIERLASPSKMFHRQGAISVPDRSLTETDMAIIGSLQRDPWKPYPAVAKELGLSARTVKRRVTRLSGEGAIYMLPDIDLRALQGIIPAELVVDYASQELRTEVNERIGSHIRDELIFSNISGLVGYFALAVPNVSRVEQIARWAKQQNGVREVHSEVLQDVVINRSYYEQWPTRVRREVGREPALKIARIAK